MNGIRGLAILLLLQSIGEIASHALGLALPGPVVGMLLLLGALNVPAIRVPVQACASFLLGQLSLLFVPVGVGVISHLDLVTKFGLRIVLVIGVSTAIGLAVTALSLHFLVGSSDA